MNYFGKLTTGAVRPSQLYMLSLASVLVLISCRISATTNKPDSDKLGNVLSERKRYNIMLDGFPSRGLPAQVCIKSHFMDFHSTSSRFWIKEHGNERKSKTLCRNYFISNQSYVIHNAVSVDDTVVLQCSNFNLTNPNISWTWTEEKSSKIKGKPCERTEELVSSSYTLNKFSREMEGEYECEVCLDGKLHGKVTFKLIIGTAPQANPISDVLMAAVGTSIDIPCKAFENDNFTVYPQMKLNKFWTKSSGVLDSVQNPISSDGTLSINNIQNSDFGDYICIIYNNFGKSIHTASLTRTGIEIRVKENKSVTLECKHSGTVRWMKNGDLIKVKQTILTNGNGHYIKSVKDSDGGTYCCIVDSRELPYCQHLIVEKN